MAGLSGLSGLSGLTGIAGGAAAWTPASLSSLTAWFDPSYGTYSDAGTTPAVVGDPVYRWVSRNSGSIYAQQATLARRPIYDGTYITGDGVNDIIVVPQFQLTSAMTGNCTVVAVVKRLAYGVYNSVHATTSGEYRAFRFTNGNTSQTLSFITNLYGPSVTDATKHIIASCYDHTNSLIKQSFDGAAYTTQAWTPEGSDMDFAMFSRYDDGLPLNGNLQALIVCDSVLSIEDVGLLKTYFGL